MIGAGHRRGNTRRGGPAIAVALTCTLALAGLGLAASAADCEAASTGLTPLTDLAGGTYMGEEGGLYPGGVNQTPPEHLATGLEAAGSIVPRGPDGAPSEAGSIAVVSIGVSNTRFAFDSFIDLAAGSRSMAEAIVLVNGAQVGRAMGQWSSARNDATWRQLEQELASAGVSPAQVQAAWIMLPNRDRGPATLAEARDEIESYVAVLQIARRRYPNLALAFVSSREYGGYISEGGSEPHAYHHAFGVKWLIEDQMSGRAELNPDPAAGPVLAPWLAWGPYVWADGLTPRQDGQTWECADFVDIGVHTSDSGQAKVASALLDHFTTHPAAAPWFTDSSTVPSTESSIAVPDTSPPETIPPTQPPATDQGREDRNDNEATSGARTGPDPERRDELQRRREAAASGPALADVPWVELTAGMVVGAGGAGGVSLWLKRRRRSIDAG